MLQCASNACVMLGTFQREKTQVPSMCIALAWQVLERLHKSTGPFIMLRRSTGHRV